LLPGHARSAAHLRAITTLTHEAIMSILRTLNPTVASLLLAFSAGSVWAQTPPTKPVVKPAAKPAAKTLGGKTAGSGKVMTREELRSCMKRLEDVNAQAKAIEAQRPSLDREREALKIDGEALTAERAEVDRLLSVVREWETRMRAHAVEIETFNKRSTAAKDAPRKDQEKMIEALNGDRERLQKTRDALTAEQARVVPAYQASVKSYNERAAPRDAKVADWNERNNAAVDASVKQQEDRALWLNECANRPYLEDDETAIKAGK